MIGPYPSVCIFYIRSKNYYVGSWWDKESALFSHLEQSTLYRLGENRFKNGLMLLDCKVQNCEPCAAGGHDCPDQ